MTKQITFLSLIVLLMVGSMNGQNYVEGTDQFGGGLVSIPAENYASIRVDPNGNNAFSPATDEAGYNGASYLKADTAYMYNDSGNYPSGITSDVEYAQDYAPAVSYNITFNQTGDHYLLLHKMFLDGSSDSFFWSLDAVSNDGVLEESGQKVQGSSSSYGNWDWKFADGPLPVPTAGEYVLTIYMREGNVKLDHIVISTDSAFDVGFDTSWEIADAPVAYTEGADQFGGGLVSIPAEDYTSIRVDPDGNNAFSPATDEAGYNGASYLNADTDYMYNDSGNYPSGITSDVEYAQDYAPAVSYNITFNQTGDHYLLLHKMFLDGSSDSFFWSLDAVSNDGVLEESGQKVQGSSSSYGNWDWKFADGPLPVPTAGEYVLTIYMREGRVKLDHIVISTDSAFDVDFDTSWVLKVDEKPLTFETNLRAVGNRIYVSNVTSNTEINLYSITGSLVRTFKTYQDIDFSFNSGLYIGTIKTDEGQKSVKLLVK